MAELPSMFLYDYEYIHLATFHTKKRPYLLS